MKNIRLTRLEAMSACRGFGAIGIRRKATCQVTSVFGLPNEANLICDEKQKANMCFCNPHCCLSRHLYIGGSQPYLSA